MKKIAMFGGSFNPVHKAHINLVKRMKDKFSLDVIYVVPTFTTPFKDNTQMISAEHRYNMCKLGFEDLSYVIVSDIEISRQGKSYTADTLSQLYSLHPEDELFLITGADSFMQMEKWYSPDRIFALSHILTVSRGEYDAQALNQKKSEFEATYNARVSIVYEPIALISSTNVRDAIKNKQEFTHLLHNKVSDYIKINGLYSYECK